MTNLQVVNSFLNGQSNRSKTGALWTNGQKLWSYYTVIAEWHNGVVVVNSTHYSMTTSAKHLSPLKNQIAKKELIFINVGGKQAPLPIGVDNLASYIVNYTQ